MTMGPGKGMRVGKPNFRVLDRVKKGGAIAGCPATSLCPVACLVWVPGVPNA